MKNNNIDKEFEFAFSAARSGLIAILLTFAICYQYLSYDKKYSNTFFSNDTYMKKAIGASFLTGFIASLTFFYVLYARNSIALNGLASMYILFMIFFILFLYDILLEAGGINKWLATNDITEENNSYAILNNIDNLDEETKQYLSNIDAETNPFNETIMRTFSTIISLAAIYLGYVAIFAFVRRYHSGLSNVSDILYSGKSTTESSMSNFSGELVFLSLQLSPN